MILQGNNWYGRYRESVPGPDGSEFRIRRSTLLGSRDEFPTKRLAERHLEALLAPINSLSYRPGRVAAVAEFAERWKQKVLSKRKASTIHAAESHPRNQILPLLRKTRLKELGVEAQRFFVNRLSGTVSRKMLLNVLGTLSSMLKTAQNWGYICEGISFNKLVLPEKAITRPSIFFTSDQVRSMLAEAKGWHRVMLAIAAMTGLRIGEILALRASDFDLDRRLLTVHRSVRRGKLGTPKTSSSHAVLPLPDALAGIVREHIATLKSEWLFLNTRGGFLTSENVERQVLVPILDELGLPRCGFHAFRHTHATLLLYNATTPQEAQAQLRHADPRITIGVYSHIQAESRRVVVEKVASVLALDGPNQQTTSRSIQ